MASRARYEFIVGLVFFVALVILGYYTVMKSKNIFEKDFAYKVTVVFPTVAGLELNSKVKINGVESGTVEHIELHGHKVRVTLRMFNEFSMYENYKIAIVTEAALGGKIVSINPGFPVDDSGHEFAIVETRENLQGGLEDTLASITSLIEENREELKLAIVNLRQILEKVNRGKGTLGKLINDDDVHKNTDNLVKEMREAVEDAREQAPVTSFLRAALTAF